MVGSGYIHRFRELNNRVLMHGKNVLVVGGTGGIGAAAAIKFSQMGANVTIGGRNQKSGDEMVAKMKAASPCPDAQFHYLPVDITVMADVKRFTRDYMEINKEGLHTLLVTSGGLNMGARRDTSEGIEHNFAISYLGRFLVINKLLPLLLKGADSIPPGESSTANESTSKCSITNKGDGEKEATRTLPGVRVMSVLSAGLGDAIEDLDDIEMKKPGAYGKSKSHNTNSILNDFMMEDLTAQTKGRNISFFHLAPGVVATDILRNNNVPGASILTPLTSWFGTQPEEYAEVLAYIATAPEFGPERSGNGLNNKAQEVTRHKYLSTPGAREKVWQYSVETSGLNKD